MMIAEVSKKYDIPADTLRYYERIGLIPPVNRKSNGIRDYTEDDCSWVYFIKCMRSVGLSIEVLVEYVTMFQQGNSTIQSRKELLVEQRNQLAARIEEMQEVLKRLDMKIDGYEDRVVKYEVKLKNLKDK
jgi:MerR family transcriptional regulator, aldehyde-responsive regulator